MMSNVFRCPWCGDSSIYVQYHDEVWGVPQGDSRKLFAKLCLDGQQAGLSWLTVLRKRSAYYEAFDNFDPEKIASYNDRKLESLLQNPGIIRNRLKVESIRRNARAYIAMAEENEPLSDFLWKYVDGRPLQNNCRTVEDVPVSTALSDRISKELKKRGFNFVGTIIVYSFMEAVGMVNDHLIDCHRHEPCAELGNHFSRE